MAGVDVTDSWCSGAAREGAATSSRDLPSGATIGGYLVEHLLAAGGCGSVYLARRASDGGRAAVKVLHRELAAERKIVERFAREVAILQRLRHPHIVEIYDVGALPDGTPFYAMEYLAGTTLDRMISARGRLSAEEVLAILEPVCLALEAAHAEGIVHRDVKGSNIAMVGEDPATIKLLDFGIAKLVGPEGRGVGLSSGGQMIGTPTIMSPEQLLGGEIDARTDIYALGALAYRCLTGRRPFEAAQLVDLVRQHLEEPARPPSQRVSLAPAIDAVVLRCLEKSPADRFDSVKSFLRALREAVEEGPGLRTSSIPEWGTAVGIYVEARMRAIQDDVDEALAEEIGGILDFVEEELSMSGFMRASVTSTEILGVRLLPDDLEARGRERRAALRLALSLHERLAARTAGDLRVHVNVAVHNDGVSIRQGARPEIVGGPLTRTQDWAPAADVDRVAATIEAIYGLDDVVSEPGRGRHALIVTPGRSGGRCAPDAPTLPEGDMPAAPGRPRSDRATRPGMGPPGTLPALTDKGGA
ncbi:MAG: serine/threonine protein kinase [Polyangiaceae bacterium]|nr:serine/threonine protein kinase [Polyangiaceae bacterium]